MLLQKERELIVEYGKKLVISGLTKGTGGNISIFNREENLFVISPSGIDYFETEPEDIAVCDLEGNVVDGKSKPSSELDMHRVFYQNREDIDAVVHAHSIFSTTLATLGEGLPASNYLIATAGKDVRCAEYASFGTWELAQNVLKAMDNRYACFLANHGLLTGAKDLPNAFNIAETIEHCAEIYVRARSIGTPVILSDEEMEYMLGRFKTYGQVKPKVEK